jgi:hypothetical protein
MSGAVKIRLSLLPSGEIAFDVVQGAAFGGSKPLWKFCIAPEHARELHEQLAKMLSKVD